MREFEVALLVQTEHRVLFRQKVSDQRESDKSLRSIAQWVCANPAWLSFVQPKPKSARTSQAPINRLGRSSTPYAE